MSPSLPPTKYRVHEVVVNGHRFPIVLLGLGRGGSSALVTLSNFVLQSSYHILSKFRTEGRKGGPKYVRTELLLQIVEMGLVERLEEGFNSNLFDSTVMLSTWKEFRAPIKLLAKGISVTPQSTSCTSFVDSMEQKLFDILGAPLHHGWLTNTKDDPDAAEGKFLDKDYLTAYGLRCLHESIRDTTYSVLFRNDHFSLMYKHEGKLLSLLADEEHVKKHPDGLWKVLEEVDDDGRLLTIAFIPIKQHIMKTDDEEAIALKKQKEIIEDETKEKLKMSKPSSKQRARLKHQNKLKEMEETKSQLEVQPEVKVEPEVESKKKTEEESTFKMQEATTKDDKKAKLKVSKPSKKQRDKLKHQQELQEVKPEEETEEERDDDMSQNFMHFLKEFKEDGTNAPFFEGQVKALDYCRSFRLKIDFNDLEKHHRQTARNICNNMPRVYDRLNYCACKFLLEHNEFKTKSKEVFEKTTLEISGLPAPNSVQPFSKFAVENDMSRVWELFDYGGKKVSAPTYLGRKAALGYLKFILKKHKEGRCWGGSFVLEDMVVVIRGDGSMEFVIMDEHTHEFSKEKAIADFNRFCVLIFPYFLHDEADEMPAYFDQFQVDYLVHMPDHKDKEAYDKWQKYMSNHFAFKAPQARSTLITETYEVCDSERTGPTYAPLDCHGDLTKWVSYIRNSGSVSLNDTYERGAKGVISNHYDDLTYWWLLKFGRHYCRHMLRSKRDEGITIKVQDLLIVDLMLAHVLKGEMAKAIRSTMMVNNFAGGLFSSAWRHFEASETFDGL